MMRSSFSCQLCNLIIAEKIIIWLIIFINLMIDVIVVIFNIITVITILQIKIVIFTVEHVGSREDSAVGTSLER